MTKPMRIRPVRRRERYRDRHRRQSWGPLLLGALAILASLSQGRPGG